MTNEALEYCIRAIIRHLDGDIQAFENYTRKAMHYYNGIRCECGGIMVSCRYGIRSATLCTDCGRVWSKGIMIKQCNARKIA